SRTQGARLGPGRAEPAVRDRPVADEHQGALVQRVGPVHPAADPERVGEEGERARRADGVGEQGPRAPEAVELGRLACLERPGGEPAFVCVHGYCQSSAYWAPTLDRLAAAG